MIERNAISPVFYFVMQSLFETGAMESRNGGVQAPVGDPITPSFQHSITLIPVP